MGLAINLVAGERRGINMRASNFDEDQKYFPFFIVKIQKIVHIHHMCTCVVRAKRKLFFSFFFLVFLKSSGSGSWLLKILSTKLTEQSKYSGARTTLLIKKISFELKFKKIY